MSRKLGAFDPASTASTGVVTETSDFTNLYLTFDNASTDDSSPQNVTVTDLASASYDNHNAAVGSAAILLYEGSGVSYGSSSADRLRFETSDVVLSSNFTIEFFLGQLREGVMSPAAKRFLLILFTTIIEMVLVVFFFG